MKLESKFLFITFFIKILLQKVTRIFFQCVHYVRYMSKQILLLVIKYNMMSGNPKKWTNEGTPSVVNFNISSNSSSLINWISLYICWISNRVVATYCSPMGGDDSFLSTTAGPTILKEHTLWTSQTINTYAYISSVFVVFLIFNFIVFYLLKTKSVGKVNDEIKEKLIRKVIYS